MLYTLFLLCSVYKFRYRPAAEGNIVETTRRRRRTLQSRILFAILFHQDASAMKEQFRIAAPIRLPHGKFLR